MKTVSLVLFLLLSLVRLAPAETVLGTPIAKVPFVIKKSGVYRLTKSLPYAATSGTAIVIEAPQVVVDLNGYEVVAITGSTTTATGLATSSAQTRVTVRGGTVAGFLTGVLLQGNGIDVSGLDVVRNYSTGISVAGDYAKILNNHVLQTGGATPGKNTVGINLNGNFGTIIDNDVQDTQGTDGTSVFTAGIRLVSSSTFAVIEGNRVLSVTPIAPTKTTATGILAQSGSNLTVLGNTVDGAETGFDFTGSMTGSYNNNITISTGTGYVPGGLTDLGGNH